MANRTAILAVRIIGDAESGVKALGQFDTAADRSVSNLDKASVAAGVVLGGLTAVAFKLEKAGEAAATADARVASITESMGLMGDRAGVVTDRILKAGEDLARNTGIDPNVIKQGQATLNTFQAVAQSADQMGGVFDRATVAAADLSAAGFGSVESASTMLGKALNDPVRGITALTRVGVTFTEEQRAQITAMAEAGDALGAQQQILAAVEQQVSGTAEATANASDKMNVAWQLTQEELGKKLLPVFEKLRDMSIDAATWIADNSDLVLFLAGAVGTLSAGILVINGAMKVYAAVQAIQTAAQIANNAAWLASPVTWIVLAVVAAIALLIAAVALVIQNWDEIAQKATEVWGAVVQWIRDVFDWLGRLTKAVMPPWLADALGLQSLTLRVEAPTTSRTVRDLFTAAEITTGFTQPATSKMATAPAWNNPGGLGAPRGGGDRYDVVINFNGLVTDPEGAAREIRKILSDDALRQGRRRPEEAGVW